MPKAISMTDVALLRLMQIASPSFPVGAYTYSHGLEWAVEDGRVRTAADLQDWIDGALSFGSGRTDAVLMAAAWRAASHASRRRYAPPQHEGTLDPYPEERSPERISKDGPQTIDDIMAEALAWRGSRELALESEAQGNALWRAVQAIWPDRLAEIVLEEPIAFAPLFGLVAAKLEIGLEDTLLGYLHAFAANLVSAGVRLVPLGQSDGQRVLASLEDTLLETLAFAIEADLSEVGTATAIIDWASLAHETQYTRLFRS